MKIIAAVTGASGAVYARRCLEILCQAPQVERIALIVSDRAAEVLEYEGERLPASPKAACTEARLSGVMREDR